MRYLATFLLLVPLIAQEPAKPPDQTAATPAPAAPPAPPGENWFKGSFEAGYRWIPDIDGNFNAYRSVVNLGEGLKLFDADFTLRDPSKRFFDRADIRATGWGG